MCELWLDGSTIVLLAVMAVQEAISAFGLTWIARSFQTSWRAAGAVAHTKIEVSVNAYAVEKVQEVCASHPSTARFWRPKRHTFSIVHKKVTISHVVIVFSALALSFQPFVVTYMYDIQRFVPEKTRQA